MRIRWYCRMAVENGIQDEHNAVYYRILSNRLARRQLGTIEQLAQEASDYTTETPGLFLDQEFPYFGFGPNNSPLPLIEFGSFSAKMFEEKKRVTKAKIEARRAKMKVKQEEENEPLVTKAIPISSFTFYNGGFSGGFNTDTQQSRADTSENGTKRLKTVHDTTQSAEYLFRRQEQLKRSERAVREGDVGMAELWSDSLNETSIYDFPDDGDPNRIQTKLDETHKGFQSHQRKEKQQTPVRGTSVLSLRSNPSTPSKRTHSLKERSPEFVKDWQEVPDSQPTSPTAASTLEGQPPYSDLDPKLLSKVKSGVHNGQVPRQPHAPSAPPPSTTVDAKTVMSVPPSSSAPQPPHAAQSGSLPFKLFQYSGVHAWVPLTLPNKPETAYGFFYRLKFQGVVPSSHKMEPGSSSLYFRAEGAEEAKVLTDDESTEDIWNSPIQSFVVSHSLFHVSVE